MILAKRLMVKEAGDLTICERHLQPDERYSSLIYREIEKSCTSN
jgi:hypothetical protein